VTATARPDSSGTGGGNLYLNLVAELDPRTRNGRGFPTSSAGEAGSLAGLD